MHTFNYEEALLVLAERASGRFGYTSAPDITILPQADGTFKVAFTATGEAKPVPEAPKHASVEDVTADIINELLVDDKPLYFDKSAGVIATYNRNGTLMLHIENFRSRSAETPLVPLLRAIISHLPDLYYAVGNDLADAVAEIPQPVPLTDKQKMLKLLTEFGVKFTEASDVADETKIVLTVERDNYDITKIIGYSNFSTDINFNLDGSFKNIGIWE